jgi:hypothetical protein
VKRFAMKIDVKFQSQPLATAYPDVFEGRPGIEYSSEALLAVGG